MPTFVKPSSPTRSIKSVDFKGKSFSHMHKLTPVNLEFKLSQYRERKSAPPSTAAEPVQSSFNARTMPNFSKLHKKSLNSTVQMPRLTVPEDFDLASERRS
jgi:hypothetical protein